MKSRSLRAPASTSSTSAAPVPSPLTSMPCVAERSFSSPAAARRSASQVESRARGPPSDSNARWPGICSCRRRSRCGGSAGRPRWEDELVAALGGHDQFGVVQLHLHVVAGRDVGHVHLEDVGGAPAPSSALVLPSRPGGLVADARALLLPICCACSTQPPGTPSACTAACVEPGKVWPSTRALAFVGVALRDGDVSDPSPAHVDLSRLQRQRVERRITNDGEVQPFGLQGLAVVGEAGDRAPEGEGPDREQHGDQRSRSPTAAARGGARAERRTSNAARTASP